MAGTDCGFASTSKSMANTQDISWMKVTALAQGARLATQRLYDQQAPVSTPFQATTQTARVVLVHSPANLTSVYRLSQLLAQASPVCHLHLLSSEDREPERVVRDRPDWPVIVVGLSADATVQVQRVCDYVNEQCEFPRRPATPLLLQDSCADDEVQQCDAVCDFVTDQGAYDKRELALTRHPAPDQCEVVVVGAGLLGLYAGTKLAKEGVNVCVLDRRNVAGGIWSLYANATSQVNTSEGAYSVKELLPAASPCNKDHSSAKEILTDLQQLAVGLGSRLKLGVTINNIDKVTGADGQPGYILNATLPNGRSHRIHARGVIMAINDRVGVPRPFTATRAPDCIPVVQGIADEAQTAKLRWQGKRVVIVGMGAFAVENARTALESGAEHVTVVCRRMGTVCPKVIDYANFTTPWNEKFQHDMRGNAKQMKRWRKLYELSGATMPPTWPKQIKPKGHTISVSDIWFVGHKLGKLSTIVGAVEQVVGDGVVLADGQHVACDVVVPCIGFIRNTDLCQRLTGCEVVCNTNYLGENLMYLADAEIDDDAFNSFFGSSVLEYAKFFTSVFLEGWRRPAALGPLLWGPDVPRVPINKRAWSQYIKSSATLINADDAIKKAARKQVDDRTARFFATLPPKEYESSNRQDWKDLHTLLSVGSKKSAKDVEADLLPYFTDL